MTDRDAEARLARALASAAPNRLDELLKQREARPKETEKVVPIQAARSGKKKRGWRTLAVSAAAALLLVGGGGGFLGWR